MPIDNAQKAKLNNMCPVARDIKLGDQIQNLTGTPAAVQAASVAVDVATLKADFNALLTKLKAAGLMANS